MGVDLGRLRVGVTEELLDRAERFPVGRQARAERMAQIVKSDDMHARVAAGALKALGDLAAIDGVAGLWVRETRSSSARCRAYG